MILEIDRYIIIPAIIIFWFIIPIVLFFGLTPFNLIEDSSSKYTFTIRPILRLGIASILGGIGIALSIVLLFHNFSVTLICKNTIESRANIQCNLDTEGIVIRHQNQSISSLLSARLNIRQKKKEENEDIAEPILITSQEEINLGGLFGSSDIEKVNKIVNDINLFINNSEQELQITKNDSIFIQPLMWVSSIFIIFPLLITTLSSSRYCSFDAESEDFVLMFKSCFRKKVLSQASLRKIEKVELESRSGEESRVYVVWLHLRSGEKLSLTGIANNYGYHNSLAKSIRKFMKESRDNNNEDE